MTGSRRNPRRAFTLVELLAVMAIVGLLSMLLLPAVQQSRGMARRTQCVSSLRQLALASQSFHGIHQHFPPGLEQTAFPRPPRFRGTSVFAYLLPHLEEGMRMEGWDYVDPLANVRGGVASRTATTIPVLQCPADSIPPYPVKIGNDYFGMTSYGGNGGSRSFDPEHASTDGMFHTTGAASEPTANQHPVAMAEVTDGASHTLLFGERRHDDANFETFVEASWTESLSHLGRWAAIGGRRRIGDVTLSAFAPINYQLPWSFESRQNADPPLRGSRDFAFYEERRVCAFGSQHVGGANLVSVDGSARFHSDRTAFPLLQALCTRAGEEVIEDE